MVSVVQTVQTRGLAHVRVVGLEIAARRVSENQIWTSRPMGNCIVNINHFFYWFNKHSRIIVEFLFWYFTQISPLIPCTPVLVKRSNVAMKLSHSTEFASILSRKLEQQIRNVTWIILKNFFLHESMLYYFRNKPMRCCNLSEWRHMYRIWYLWLSGWLVRR